ncbi:cyclophilin-like protein [Mytilinidion resinicola]|uniref:Peptidyl-prolyl cis-trans isomerase-like 2 n=1 Tax=Mytilinidion resinicola TaxID=574789 RepID=A0A6A6ZA30_9PEZI|nr:cyclophilin-like protein [Mytilinidion resinicola]KAF2817982.1 cyclophilin-like protein [Mytilinidion resinicola]
MGKNTDKLYITHSEWASEDSFGTSRGFNASKSKAVGSSFKRLPFNFCAVSLQPFTDPVCTAAGTIFDLTHILTWLQKHGTNPIDGSPLKRADLITLNFAKNEDNEYVDPVTYKVFTDNTHIVTLKNTGNVFAWDTVERLNIKAKNWRDLVSDDEFSRKDIITLQDPQNIESRDLSAFKHIKDGEVSAQVPEESNVNADALGSAGKILRAKEAVAKARTDRQAKAQASNDAVAVAKAKNATATHSAAQGSKPKPYNAAQYTTGKAAASFTSTGWTPHTSAERAVLSEEDYMLRPKRVKQKGYARISTSLGDLNIELLPEFAPKAVWNFVQLAKKGYYKGTLFHRNIKNFMIQGGDPTGTGKGGQSCWGKPFNDELEGPLLHNARGVISMANKGKNTNTSQFFILYRQASHLDRKHSIFAKVVGGLDTTLTAMENAKTGEKDRPEEDLMILDVVVFVDPFEEFRKERSEKEDKEREEEEIRLQGGREDDKTQSGDARWRSVQGGRRDHWALG